MKMQINQIQEFTEQILNNLEKVIVGKRQTLELSVVGLICQGHILIEDVPGVGKTILARSLAKSIDCSFKRIQFTPDMLPSDVTGVSIFNQINRQFEFRAGPIVTQILLADEINRATPKTQSALLEGMEEKQITVDGITYPLPQPFLVIATLNPIEYEGTFPLPEAQLDRFLLRVRMGYPSLLNEIQILEVQQIRHPIESLEPVINADLIVEIQNALRHVFVAPAIKKYIVDINRATRGCEDVYLGASPRGSIGLFRAGQARAAMQGRDYVIPDDIKYLAECVLGHRIIVNPGAKLRDISSEEIISELLHNIPIPSADFHSWLEK
jgi:MoxR-like ATPase